MAAWSVNASQRAGAEDSKVTTSPEGLSLAAPVGPYSPPAAIKEWVTQLQAMSDSADVAPLIAEAHRWLEIQENYINIV